MIECHAINSNVVKKDIYFTEKNMKANFESNLAKLEALTEDIKREDITLEEALKDFEQGIKLARGMEAEIDKIEGKIQILMNSPVPETDDTPELDLFAGDGTSVAPEAGTRK